MSSLISVPIAKGAWPIIGHLPRFIQDKNQLVTYSKLHAELGDRVRFKLPGLGQIILTKNPDDAKTVLMEQGPFPFRTNSWVWDRIFKQQGWPTGIPWATGEQWRTSRKVLNKTLLQVGTSFKYVNQVIPKANHLAEAVEMNLDKKTGVCQVELKRLYGLFALEAVARVVLGSNLSLLLQKELPKDSLDFVKSVEDMFSWTRKAENNPLSRILDTKEIIECKNSWNIMWTYASKLIDAVLDPYMQTKIWPEHLSEDQTILPLLVHQMEQGEISRDELVAIGVQAIAAAVDTTSQTLEYLMYNLGTHSEIQEQLFAEISSAFPNHEIISEISDQQYDSLKLVKAALKESMRLTPTVGMHVRKLQADTVLGGDYLVPAGQNVMINYRAMCHNEEIFSNAQEFNPYRFVRSESKPSHHPFAAIPFGHGGRKCAGAGFAQLDVHLATICLIQKFQVSYTGPPLKVTEKMLLRPDEDIDSHFTFSLRK